MHTDIQTLHRSLQRRPPAREATDGDPARAAVALLFRLEHDLPELLLIRRAHREGDPWSGQIALPGGRWSPGDESLEATALRETWEETGIEVRNHGAVIGMLDELRPRTPTLPPIIVTPFAALLHQVPALQLSDEVAEAFWAPWEALRDPATSQTSTVHVRGSSWQVPSFVLGPHVVWGMTERILRGALDRMASEGSPV